MGPPTAIAATGHGARLEWLTTGVGEPTTVFAHGLAGDIAGTRPFGSAVAGRRVFFHFRGHGRSTAPSAPWTYDDLARDLAAVADLSGARRALGVSLGAGALCRLLAGHPGRFDRLVFYLPAALDTPRPPEAVRRLARLTDAATAGDADTLAGLLGGELPEPERGTPAATAYLADRVARLLAAGSSLAGLAGLAGVAPLTDAGVLGAVPAPALVIAGTGDDRHPVPVAERLAAALPQGRLRVYDSPAPLWTHRADLRELISGFLNVDASPVPGGP